MNIQKIDSNVNRQQAPSFGMNIPEKIIVKLQDDLYKVEKDIFGRGMKSVQEKYQIHTDSDFVRLGQKIVEKMKKLRTHGDNGFKLNIETELVQDGKKIRYTLQGADDSGLLAKNVAHSEPVIYPLENEEFVLDSFLKLDENKLLADEAKHLNIVF